MLTFAKQNKTTSAAANSALQIKELNADEMGKAIPFFQPKLTIGSSDDIFEKEAHETADKVMRMPIPEPINFSPGKNSVQRKCAHCEEEEKQLHRKENSGESISTVPPIVHDVLSSGGKNLDTETRSFMEPRFNYDFSNVKIHDNDLATKSASSINALAYTSGNDIVFNTGQYDTNSDSGKRLLAHELTHVVQQGNFIRMQPATATTNAQPTATDRREYREEQERFFVRQGEIMSAQILRSAQFSVQPTTPADAERLIRFWGLSMSTIVTQMGQIASSLSTRVLGQVTLGSLAQQQQNFINALSPTGQRAYAQAIRLVRAEAFWNTYFNNNDIYIFPDLQGNNRFSGYNQALPDPNDPTGQRRIIIVHISMDPLNNNFVEISSSTIVHELSHVIYEPAVLDRALSSFRNTISELLVDHPNIVTIRQGVANPALAREEQRKRISQILYETLAYGEEEIFVHLQQLTHQPDITIRRPDGTTESLRAAQVLQHEVLRYVRRLRQIGLERHMLIGVLDQIGRRVDIMFDNRINALPPGSQQQIMLNNKRMAQLLFDMARRDQEL